MHSVQLVQKVELDSQSVFYFRSYDKMIGRATDLKELASEMRRLEFEDPAALKYHLVQGHIVRWLRSLDDAELAIELDGVENISLAERMVEEFLERKSIIRRMRQGRMH
jgi:hypothetical protein